MYGISKMKQYGVLAIDIKSWVVSIYINISWNILVLIRGTVFPRLSTVSLIIVIFIDIISINVQIIFSVKVPVFKSRNHYLVLV